MKRILLSILGVLVLLFVVGLIVSKPAPEHPYYAPDLP